MAVTPIEVSIAALTVSLATLAFTIYKDQRDEKLKKQQKADDDVKRRRRRDKGNTLRSTIAALDDNSEGVTLDTLKDVHIELSKAQMDIRLGDIELERLSSIKPLLREFRSLAEKSKAPDFPAPNTLHHIRDGLDAWIHVIPSGDP